MVLLDRALVCSYRLSIVTMSLTAAISNIVTARSTSTASAFEVITVNALYKLLTYLLTYLLINRNFIGDQILHISALRAPIQYLL